VIPLILLPAPDHQNVSLGEGPAHTPTRLVDKHIAAGGKFLHSIRKNKVPIGPDSWSRFRRDDGGRRIPCESQSESVSAGAGCAFKNGF
jgi:hypothetical protein